MFFYKSFCDHFHFDFFSLIFPFLFVLITIILFEQISPQQLYLLKKLFNFFCNDRSLSIFLIFSFQKIFFYYL